MLAQAWVGLWLDLRSPSVRDRLETSAASPRDRGRRPIDSGRRWGFRRTMPRSRVGAPSLRRRAPASGASAPACISSSRGDGQAPMAWAGQPTRPPGASDRRAETRPWIASIALMDTANGRPLGQPRRRCARGRPADAGPAQVGPARGRSAAAFADRAGHRGGRRRELGRPPELLGPVDPRDPDREHRRACGLGRHRVLLPDGPWRPLGVARALWRLQHGARPAEEGRGGHAAGRRRRADATLPLPRPARRHPDRDRGVPPPGSRVVDVGIRDPTGRSGEDRRRDPLPPGPVAR